MPKSDILAELKSAIAGKSTPHPAATPAPQHQPPRAPGRKKTAGRPHGERPAKTAVPSPRSGKGVQFYLKEGDRKIINGLAVWFMSRTGG